MQLSKTELVKALVKTLKIDDNIFNYEAIREELEHLQDCDFMDFYKKAISTDAYGNGMKVIIEISEQFKNKKLNVLLEGTHEQAKAMYDKFYVESALMLEHTANNRKKIPNDREWFESIDYTSLKKKDGSGAYTKQELYVLNELGDGSFLIDIRFHQNSNEVVKKIERIIKEAVSVKYATAGAIENKNVKKLIGEIQK